MSSAAGRDARAEERAVGRLARLARNVSAAPADPELDRAGRARVLLEVRRVLDGSARSWVLPIALACVALAGLVALAVVLWPKPLRYEVRGARLDGPYVSATTTPVSVEFSDGSVARAAVGSRLRVDALERDAARVLVERGRVTVELARSRGARFGFLAGPFEIRASGAHFELEWDPAFEVVEVDVREGSVDVYGPLGGPVSVRGGQRFRAELAARRMIVLDAIEDMEAPPQ